MDYYRSHDNLAYCEALEMIYGTRHLSEGGETEIKKLLGGFDYSNSSILEIGFGLGGLSCYLTEKFDAFVTGLEISSDALSLAQKRLPKKLSPKINYQLYKELHELPIKSSHFDFAISKGVLVHVDDKNSLFSEVHRSLKRNGVFLINDWLSSTPGTWCSKILRMCEIDGITLFPLTEKEYKKILVDSGFEIIDVSDCSQQYAGYNNLLSQKLLDPLFSKDFETQFPDYSAKDFSEGYKMIYECQKEGSVLVRNFTVRKL